MPEYTLKDMEVKKDMPGYSGGPAKVLELTLEDAGGETHTAEMFTMASTPLPSVGDKMEGTIEASDYGPKWKKAGGRQGGGGGFKKSPEQEKRIVRQHSQEMACRVMATLGYVLPEESFLNLVQWFVDDAYAKMKGGANGWPTTSDIPADQSDLFDPTADPA